MPSRRGESSRSRAGLRWSGGRCCARAAASESRLSAAISERFVRLRKLEISSDCASSFAGARSPALLMRARAVCTTRGRPAWTVERAHEAATGSGPSRAAAHRHAAPVREWVVGPSSGRIQIGGDVNVVEAEDRDLLGDLDSALGQLLHHANRGAVVHADDGSDDGPPRAPRARCRRGRAELRPRDRRAADRQGIGWLRGPGRRPERPFARNRPPRRRPSRCSRSQGSRSRVRCGKRDAARSTPTSTIH